jgi:hypothetical protein
VIAHSPWSFPPAGCRATGCWAPRGCIPYPSTTITVSVGVAGGTWQLPGDCDLPILADQALYAAKAAGRNRYVVANNLRPVMRARTETT